jgi:hypothetical protein
LRFRWLCLNRCFVYLINYCRNSHMLLILIFRKKPL